MATIGQSTDDPQVTSTSEAPKFVALEIAMRHRLLMRLAVIRAAVESLFFAYGNSFGVLHLVVSFVLGAVMAFQVYRVCKLAFDGSTAFGTAILVFTPCTWIVAILILGGNLSDHLYKHCGSVGFFGVSEKQLGKLRSKNAGTAHDASN